MVRRYPADLDWTDDLHLQCNNNVHPSRHGTYDGISMHPFETVCVPACRNWLLQRVSGQCSVQIWWSSSHTV